MHRHKIKVLVVDDSAFMRKLVQEFLSENERIAVVGTARNGEDAIAKVRLLKPDVITMDVEMPVMSGLEALKYMMKENPLPVIMLSSTTRKGAENALLAMDYGAVDFIAKPSGTISLDLHLVKKELIQKVLHAAEASLPSQPERSPARIPVNTSKNKAEITDSKVGRPNQTIILIGTSTGGPRALQSVLSALPGNLKAPVLIVQHMPPGFTKSLAQRLDQLSALHVKEAEEGDVLADGHAYVAPGDFHLNIIQGTRLSLSLSKEPPISGHRPSVDFMFESASKLKNIKKIAVIMTGMGADGSKGLVQLNHNGQTQSIAESKETCVVYGMPKAAHATGLITYNEPLDEIAKRIVKLAEG
ncbi:protein-glutamate methylesterase/protein-glutamine glutaminase [Jeotgalibacillus haloalkalitolerans]|uniref:Protein-glutamate methylesterase/protein-glutamine glutaminase n=1 Tax=Jeotgalibacillus haloalkalitolerans TaxID=3104292 RepID=A0ABU5KKE8_9BACL|nr:chemotaxis response regulator protein-glutamate methylesterase [Jeotgalibacillus sp. HH7-29]MDZ5711740.1 chemotaxis response regulator protein-glutamate methylesterase [Jeotgalibacillus sp. HH7-29]